MLVANFKYGSKHTIQIAKGLSRNYRRQEKCQIEYQYKVTKLCKHILLKKYTNFLVLF